MYCTVDVLHNHTVEQYGERAGYYSPALANYNYSHRIHPTEREIQIQIQKDKYTKRINRKTNRYRQSESKDLD